MIKTSIQNTVLFMVSIVSFFIISELCFRFYTSFTNIYDIEMYKYAKELKMKSEITDLLHEHKPNSEKELMDVSISINNIGLRHNNELENKKVNEKRIVVLGSSITMGWGVPYDSIFTTLLNDRLNEDRLENYYQIFNLGVGNYNTYLQDILFKNKVDKLKPDKVILHYFINDAEIIEHKKYNFFINNSLLIAFLSVRIKQFFISQDTKYSNIGEYYLDIYSENNEGWMQAKKSILNMKNLCKRKGLDFLCLLQPDLHDLGYQSDQYKCHLLIQDFLENKNIKYYDLFDDFHNKYNLNSYELWIQKDDPHPNQKGHQLMYESLYKYLTNYK